MRLCHFEDAHTIWLEPLTLNRPAFELRCGLTTLQAKQSRSLHAPFEGMFLRDELAPLFKQQHPEIRVNDLDWLGQETTILVNSRWLPSSSSSEPIWLPTLESHLGLIHGEIAYALLEPEHLRRLSASHLVESLQELKGKLSHRDAKGRLVRHLWELVDVNGTEITCDFDQMKKSAWKPETLSLIGSSENLFVDPSARIDPLVVADTTNGPVVIDREAVIHSFTRLEGPCYIGPRTQILGAKIRSGTTIGPECRIGGEVEASIIQGFTNKYHEGFLGHSFLGEWVNLGAGVHTSDLRNDYGKISVILNGQSVSTGRTKIGSYLGDHTKVGLGCLLNSGTNVGVFCNLLPTGSLLPKNVPSFCWVKYGEVVEGESVDDLFTTAKRVMKRRGQEFTALHETLYRELFDELEVLRLQTVQEAASQRWRKAA